jgi:hypothetical protein
MAGGSTTLSRIAGEGKQSKASADVATSAVARWTAINKRE